MLYITDKTGKKPRYTNPFDSFKEIGDFISDHLPITEKEKEENKAKGRTLEFSKDKGDNWVYCSIYFNESPCEFNIGVQKEVWKQVKGAYTKSGYSLISFDEADKQFDLRVKERNEKRNKIGLESIK